MSRLWAVGVVGVLALGACAEETVAGPGVGDHWHAAFGVFVCDDFVADPAEFETPTGIHTHGDGVVHLHPFGSPSREDGTLVRFLDDAGIELEDGRLTVDGETVEGDDCGGEPAVVQVASWDDAEPGGEPDDVRSGDLGDVRFAQDGQAFTVAFLPEGEDIPLPPTATDLENLGALDSASSAGD